MLAHLATYALAFVLGVLTYKFAQMCVRDEYRLTNRSKRYERLVLSRTKGWDLREGLAEYDKTGWSIKGMYITDSGEQVCLILEREIE